VHCYDNNLVGFKWICNLMDQVGPADFVYGTEESHGFLVGQYCRDKDGAVACLLMAELVAQVRAQGKSVVGYLEQLHRDYGHHAERLITIQMEGSDGMRRMKDLMEALRNQPPRNLGGLSVSQIRDYGNSVQFPPGGPRIALTGPRDNLVFIETDRPGNYVAARPSGTEPKVKFYMFTYCPPADISADTAQDLSRRLDDFGRELQAFAAQIP
jgi:phosphoglucomutase/phosphomannomutase